MKTFPHHSLLCKKYIDGKSQAAISVINKGFLSGTLTKISLLGLVWAYLLRKINSWCGRSLIHIIYLQSLKMVYPTCRNYLD